MSGQVHDKLTFGIASPTLSGEISLENSSKDEEQMTKFCVGRIGVNVWQL